MESIAAGNALGNDKKPHPPGLKRVTMHSAQAWFARIPISGNNFSGL
jgi:hypothetical protein